MRGGGRDSFGAAAPQSAVDALTLEEGAKSKWAAAYRALHQSTQDKGISKPYRRHVDEAFGEADVV
ncbi:hypothetical protein AWV80_29855 [Cupriavidus sp. UYMU48A]|nr:hypothetical protein AWV80_29855 [Cupriavidus sp. UYMU48A]